MEETKFFFKFIMKFIILPVFLTTVFNFLEYGLIWDRFIKFLYPMTLSGLFIINMYVPKLRRFSLALAYGLLILMILLYLVGQLNLSNLIGSFGFALLLIVIFCYMPQIIKKGFLEKF